MKFLVADDHELIRQGVKGMLRGLDPDALFDEADSWETLATAARPFFEAARAGCRSLCALDRTTLRRRLFDCK